MCGYGTVQLICDFVFIYAKNRFSHDAAQMMTVINKRLSKFMIVGKFV